MKPNILLLIDRPNWAYDFAANSLIKYLSFKYNFAKGYSNFNSSPNSRIENYADFDIIYNFYYGDTRFIEKNHIEKNRLIAGIASHYSWKDMDMYTMVAFLLYYKAVTANSVILYNIFKDKHENVFYAPRGVDTSLFIPEKKKTNYKKLKVGWVGSLTDHPGKRGYYDYILPAIDKIDGVVLKTAAREDKWRTQKEMVDFYHSIDVYICASRTEGTPNPALEAASCGLPVVTTRVGNMPELIKDGYNGIFIERDVDSIPGAIKRLRDNRELANLMGRRNREEILKDWSWEKQVRNYDKVFEFMLAQADETIP